MLYNLQVMSMIYVLYNMVVLTHDFSGHFTPEDGVKNGHRNMSELNGCSFNFKDNDIQCSGW